MRPQIVQLYIKCVAQAEEISGGLCLISFDAFPTADQEIRCAYYVILNHNFLFYGPCFLKIAKFRGKFQHNNVSSSGRPLIYFNDGSGIACKLEVFSQEMEEVSFLWCFSHRTQIVVVKPWFNFSETVEQAFQLCFQEAFRVCRFTK